MKKIVCALLLSAVTLAGIFSEEKCNLDMVKIPETNIKMLKTEVTQSLYKSVMGVNPSSPYKFIGENYPIVCVSWHDAIYFCNKLSVQHGLEPVYAVNGESDVSKWNYRPNDADEQFHELYGTVTQNPNANGYRLPTYDEWATAAKGGEEYKYSGSDEIDEVAWHIGNSEQINEVAQKKSNAYGLFDMSGNATEWLWDMYDGMPKYRYLCGGSYAETSINCEITQRNCAPATSQSANLGFRIIQNAK
ncbi:MAG: formylglycine-generating enzyme family protein [Clostridiales bacterium]|nr:formylglycine-generating enzyme family protein [Clostridiales bacterium]